MSLETRLDEVLEGLLGTEPTNEINSSRLIECIDLTLLDTAASSKDLYDLQSLAQQHPVAAVCVLDPHLSFFNHLAMNLATVVNFPLGDQQIDRSLQQIDQAKTLGVTEIDFVLPYSAYLNGQKHLALDSCRIMHTHCKKQQLTLKIIIETGAFPDIQSIYQVGSELIAIGCDFLKTSTGKSSTGARVHAAFALLSAIKDSGSATGIKVSGGVKTVKQAQAYAQLAELVMDRSISPEWFRIGASSLLKELIYK